MSLETILGLLRHILTFGGGYFVTKGVATESEVGILVGGIVTLIGGGWSIWQKIQQAKALEAAKAAAPSA